MNKDRRFMQAMNAGVTDDVLGGNGVIYGLRD